MTQPAHQESDLSSFREDLVRAIEEGNAELCDSRLDQAPSRDAIYVLAGLSDDQRTRLLTLLSPEDAADVIEQLPEAQAVDSLEDLDAATAANIIGELSSDDQADLIKAIDDDEARAILDKLDTDTAANVRRLVEYHDESAGGLMHTEYFVFQQSHTIGDVLADLDKNAEKYAKYDIQYMYIIDDYGKLAGVLPIRQLLLSNRSLKLCDVMIADPISISDTMPLDELAGVFREHPFVGLPVIESTGGLLGVVEHADVEQAVADGADSVYRQSQGIVGGEELRSMPLLVRSRRRLAWLSTNIVLNILAASVIALHQETLEAVIALAVFLPIISDMSGCSGSQAVAVSIRELTLGITRPRDIVRVLFKESAVGVLNGIALGLLIGAVAYAWKGNIYLGAVLGLALMLNTIIAVCIGGAVPLILKSMKVDPALASGPILTTITDLCGFLLVLSFAAAAIGYLTG